MNHLYLALKFILGGSVILAVTLLAGKIHPKYGGLIAVAPIITVLSFIFIRYESGIQTTQQTVLFSIYYLIPTVIFLITLYFLLYKLNFISSLVVSYLLWICVILVLEKII